MNSERIKSSFRDPSGFVFRKDGEVYRQINTSYADHYNDLMSNGLYDALCSKGLLIPHEEVDLGLALTAGAYRVIKPQQLPFISYPYEWSFSQLKDAAFATLEAQKIALEHDMTIKDATAYNIQFSNGKPLIMDSLSFETYKKGEPWVAYRQFCQHFLGVLALMAYRDVRLNQMMRIHIDGVPLELVSELLPARTKLRIPLLLNLHMHASSQKRHADTKVTEKGTKKRKMSMHAMRGLIDNLEVGIRGLKWRPEGTEWADYYEGDSYNESGTNHKKQLVASFLDKVQPSAVWDMGGNTGVYSRIASDRGIPTVCFDVDPACVEINYLQTKKLKEQDLLPLVQDLTNPSPGIGWDNAERLALGERRQAETVFALALIHHLAISNNVPLDMIAQFFSRLCKTLIIEFVPKSDPKVEKLLATRADIFPNYTKTGFEKAFSAFFDISEQERLCDSERVLYLLRNKVDPL